MTSVIDAHLHVFDRVARLPRAVSELTPADRIATPAMIRARMDETGVDRAVVVALDTHDEAVREAVADHPELFSAVIVAGETEQGRTRRDPVAAVQRRVAGLQVTGVRTMWLGEPGQPFSDSPIRPLLRWMEARGLALWSYLPPQQMQLLPELARLHPDLVVILNHFGFAPHGMRVDPAGRPQFSDPFPPHEVARVRGLAAFPSLHLHFSGHYALSATDYPYNDLRQSTRSLVQEFGADRTMWGSDWPWIDAVPGYARTRALIDHVLNDASEAERADVAGGTAARVLLLPGRPDDMR